MDNTLTMQAAPSDTAGGIAEDDFDAVVRSHQRRVYRVLYVLLRDADAADTLTQECFLRAYRQRENFRGECRIDTWLLRIAVNLARDQQRSRRIKFWKGLVGFDDHSCGAAPEQIYDPRSSAEQSFLAQRELQAVWNAAQNLPSRQRTIFLLRFADEMSLVEISSLLGLKIGSVKTHLFRAIRTIRAAMKEQQWR